MSEANQKVVARRLAVALLWDVRNLSTTLPDDLLYAYGQRQR